MGLRYDDYFDDTHRLLRESARKFVEREIKPYVEEWEAEEEIPRDLSRKAAEMGLLGIGYPEELGGVPSDLFHQIIVAEEIVRCGAIGVAASLLTFNIALPPLLTHGTPEQRQRFVAPVLAGEKIAALGITEPNAGSDVAGIQTRAVADGGHFVVNGAKTFITSGCRADFLVAAVRTGGPGSGGISLLIIEADTPGYRVAKKIKKMGWHSSDTAELVFEDCRVPRANLIGEENAGFKAVMANFQNERLIMAVETLECAQLAYEESVKYAQSRVAFNRPVSGFQVTRHKLADMATKIEAARALNYAVAKQSLSGEYPVAQVSMAKNFSREVCDSVVYDAVQIHGGYGFASEYLVERLYRDSRIMSLGGGTQEIQKEIIAKRLEY